MRDEANLAKLLTSEAAWKAGEACLQTHGAFGYAREYDVERKWRETKLYQIAPISTNLILAYLGEHVLGIKQVVLDERSDRGKSRCAAGGADAD